MSTFRILTLALTLGMATPLAVQAQTKTTAKKTTTTTKKATTTTAKKPAAKTTTTTKTTTAKTAVAAAAAAVVKTPLTDAEANNGLKEALTQSINRSIEQASATDGFNANTDIRIPFPPEAELVAATMRKLRLGALVDNFEVALNRSAESAAKEAAPIFLGAVQNISFQDALGLATSKEEDAATTFLYGKTADQLKTAFQPIIQQSLEQTGATKLYAEMVARYNKIPLVTKLEPQLTPYASQKTVDGLFTLVAAEEAKIRANPAARGSELLKRVFGK
ncbi:DUF4197 domain-containing protein [Hymenobacter sp. BT186]|uniref:DUF4197 domain-containing protein n=1 Tax=Hymenobacter telluris TaxID=2816474 RepID=A0A939J8Y7_9BACT|nr:DUF4197 domain-containing protein [Hymenobacter telluris]MBO0356501.1 DUF4197 domain-containing protein [Hymenobacter telluris]MBW3372525.1 DUF4197 domain-containing protein [Hymenobacter norwichensis]